MKHIKSYNESVRQYLKPKSKENILKSINNLTPYGSYYKMEDLELNEPELIKIIEKRIKESLDELDEIVAEHTNTQLNNLVIKVAEWVDKNGGNNENILSYGFLELSSQISDYTETYDYNEIYDQSVAKSFKKLLTDFAICEVKNNNKEEEKF